MVYVISKSGKPLMPTERHGKVRRLLKAGKAKVVRRVPFTIQLLYETTEYVQPVTLGVDPGYENVGLSAVTGSLSSRTRGKEVFSAEAQIRTDIPKLLSARGQYRRARRSRKTRYRKPRFSNRGREEGWLAPSIRNKIEVHIKGVPKSHTNDAFVIAVGNGFDMPSAAQPVNQVRQSEQFQFR